MRQDARDAGAAFEHAGERVAREAKEATRTVGAALDAAAQTARIRTALIDADNLDAGGIDVDTDAANRTVRLTGHVTTEAQKAAAERIAKDKAPEYRVVNDIRVG
jgi:osmotically-inducible protein OsmY